MKFSRFDFMKALTGGAAAVPALLNASGPEPKVLDLQPAEAPMSTEALRALGASNFDVRDAIKYDRVHFTGTIIPRHFSLFSTPLGHLCGYTARTKTLGFTNMTGAGIFHPPTQFWMKRIHLVIDPETSPADARAFGQYGWRFTLLNKIYHQGSCAIDSRRVSLADLLCGDADPHSRRSLQFEYTAGLYIPMQAYFSVEFASDQEQRLDPNGVGLDVSMVFEGMEVRAVA